METNPKIRLFYSSLSKLWRDRTGQDMIEYALMAAMVAIAAGALLPHSLVPGISHIYSRIETVMSVLVN